MGTYSFTGAAQFVTVTTAGTYDIVAYGAQGGGANGHAGGAGAEVGGYVQLSAGEKLEIVVGGTGGSGSGGAGGGGTFVLGNTGNGYVPLIVAGGGGGAGFNQAGNGGTLAMGTGNGGAGGAYVNASNGDGYDGGGGAGVKSAGGHGSGARSGAGGSNGTGSYAGGGGGYGTGGFGGGGGAGAFGGGGGGGGYSGGAGGTGAAMPPEGGGGGYSLDTGTPIAAQTMAAENTGAGKVVITPNVVCFAGGTAIRVMRNGSEADVAVEHLAVGDLAVTRDGRQVPVRWLGHRNVRCRLHPTPRKVWPVRIAADTLGPGLPASDLWLSPEHALCLADTLVPARALIDGDRIAQVEQAEVTYWHVEVEGGHDVILANGMPAESYLDTGNRCFFGADGVVGLHFDEEPAHGWDGTGTCLPLIESGPRLSAIRTLYGLGQSGAAADTMPVGVHLVADGTIIQPCLVDDNELRFVVPAGTADLRLTSSSFYASGDIRRLGVLVSGLAISDGAGWQEIALDHPGLYAGFHDLEQEHVKSWRWTDGNGHLAAGLFADHAGPTLLCVAGVFTGLDARNSSSLDQQAA